MLFVVPALLVLAYASDFNRAKTLQEVLSFTWGRGGRILTSVCVAIYCFGTCITFFIIIGDQFDRGKVKSQKRGRKRTSFLHSFMNLYFADSVFASIVGPTFCHSWYMDRKFTMFSTSLILIFPFCFPKRIDFLRHVRYCWELP